MEGLFHNKESLLERLSLSLHRIYLDLQHIFISVLFGPRSQRDRLLSPLSEQYTSVTFETMRRSDDLCEALGIFQNPLLVLNARACTAP